MMICQKCQQNEATVHIVKMTSEGKAQLNLCPSCAKQYGENTGGTLGFPLNNSELIKKILQNPAQFGIKLPRAGGSGPECPRCGNTLKQIQQQGFAGCPECYRFFEDTFSRIIAGVQRSTQHRGKVPGKQQQAIALQQEVTALRSRIEELIREENYEEAAVIRDRIRALENGVKEDGI